MTTTEIAPGADYWEPPAAVTPPAPEAAAATPGRFSKHSLGLAGLLIGTAVLYLWNLSVSGWGNTYYAAAVQAGTKSWKAFLFGSFDSSNFITVDKPPAFLWPMEISARIFGLNSWSMMVPQALMGVGSVWLLFLTVRRWFGPAAGYIAGAALALTPVAVLMFRFNDPDAMMTFLMVVAAYFVTRALEEARTRWMLLTGLTMGFAFLAKGLQPFTLVPVLALVYLICAPTGLLRRVWQTLLAGAALVAGCGWWLAIVALTPAADRPYIGGSTNNSALELAFGYNGLGRITGNEVAGAGGGAGGAGGGGGGAGFSGSTGVGRLFNSLMGGQISWLLPAALIGIVALLAIAGRAGRTDRVRAAAILWGGWLLVTGAVLSYASGIIHTYYTIELAPAIAALVGVATVVLWRHRADINARLTLAVGVLVTGTWSYTLLNRTPDWHSWVRALVVIATIVAVLALVVPTRFLGRATLVAAIAGAVALGGGATAYAFSTASAAHSGGTPSAGPAVAGGQGGPGGGGQGGQGGQGGPGGGGGGGGGGKGGPGGGGGGFGGGRAGGTGGAPTGTGGQTAQPGGQAGQGAQVGGPGGGSQTASSDLTALLQASTTKWAAATIGSQNAGVLELSSGKAVMALGGFNGGDNSISLADFQQLVAAGEIHYFIGGGQGGGPGGGSNANSAISSWVSSHFSSSTVGGSTVYDLTKATS